MMSTEQAVTITTEKRALPDTLPKDKDSHEILRVFCDADGDLHISVLDFGIDCWGVDLHRVAVIMAEGDADAYELFRDNFFAEMVMHQPIHDQGLQQCRSGLHR